MQACGLFLFKIVRVAKFDTSPHGYVLFFVPICFHCSIFFSVRAGLSCERVSVLIKVR